MSSQTNDWDFPELDLSEFLRAFEEGWQGVMGSMRGASDSSDLSIWLDPVEPYNRSSVLTPLIRVAGVAGLVLLGGVAVGGFVVSFFALMAVCYLLSQVFGYELAVATPF